VYVEDSLSIGNHCLLLLLLIIVITRHQALKGVIAMYFVTADMPVTKEPPDGLSISD